MPDTDSTRLNARDLIRSALLDGIEWQLSFAVTNPGSKERTDALALVAQYRTMLKRRYGDGQTPMERAMEGVPLVDIRDLMVRDA